MTYHDINVTDRYLAFPNVTARYIWCFEHIFKVLWKYKKINVTLVTQETATVSNGRLRWPKMSHGNNVTVTGQNDNFNCNIQANYFSFKNFCSGLGKMKFKVKDHRISTKIEFSGLKVYFIRKKNLGANLLHPNFDLSNITGCPFWFWLFYAKLSYYLLKQLLKLKHLLFTFLIFISPYVWTQIFLIKFVF